MSTDFLADMAAASKTRVESARRLEPEAALLARALAAPRPPRLALSPHGFDLIAEVKLRSPAAGALRRPTENVGARAAAYARAGAAAVSVLTEPSRFDGSLAHLEAAVRALQGAAPAMRKDFLVDPYQVMEARAAGAGGVLLILRMLSRSQIDVLLSCAVQLELFVLLEAFDEADIELAAGLLEAAPVIGAAAAPLLVGVNCRDLASLEVVPGRLEALAALLPRAASRVAESGIGSAADAQRVARAGYDLALVGSALMKAADPAQLITAMLRTARAD